MQEDQQYPEQDRTRMSELNLRAEKVAHNVHVPTNEEHLGRYSIVAQQPEDESYEKRIRKSVMTWMRPQNSSRRLELDCYSHGQVVDIKIMGGERCRGMVRFDASTGQWLLQRGIQGQTGHFSEGEIPIEVAEVEGVDRAS